MLRAPVAAAFFLLCEAYGIEFRDGVRPPIAFELAAAAMSLLDPWSGNHDAISDELRERITSRKSELVRALHGADLAWWHAPLDRDHQIWLTDDTSAEAQTVCPSQPPSEVEKHIQRPLSGLVTSTAYEKSSWGRRAAPSSCVSRRPAQRKTERALPQCGSGTRRRIGALTAGFWSGVIRLTGLGAQNSSCPITSRRPDPVLPLRRTG